MLSRLIITFLCAAVIRSVSGAFLKFDPESIVMQDIEDPIRFSAKLNSKPTKEVIVHLQHPFMAISTCVIIFSPNNWNVPQTVTGIFAPVFVGSSDPPKEPAFSSDSNKVDLPRNLRDYSVVEVTRNKNGMRHSPAPMTISTELFSHMDRNSIS
ncbi:hypothetical protein BASA81_018570 [Batrachochytrium salamandrivorans]|nr:hypothetical protein BASA81_018570 [Batrachochytrium salamandrivorans]